jgi:tRNA A-37 threonylcarbamoyl transferase component Bud32
MTSLVTNIQEPQTLAQIMGTGRMPVTEALTRALSLAETLRKIHEAGGAHGALTPSQIVVNGNSVELLPLFEYGKVTPYTAPELLSGARADVRSDIFSFGAILYEMFTGRRAFDGDGPEAIAASLTQAEPASSGSPAVDRVLHGCLAKDPSARFQRVQKLTLEMKLLSVAARRAKAPAVPGWEALESAFRAEMQQMESRFAATIQMHENTIAALERTAGEALNTLRSEVAAASDERAALAERLAAVEQNLLATNERLHKIELTLESFDQNAVALRENLTAELSVFEQSLEGHAKSVDSVRTAVAQTDDLVERVVEALESLQTIVLDQAERRPSHVG